MGVRARGQAGDAGILLPHSNVLLLASTFCFHLSLSLSFTHSAFQINLGGKKGLHFLSNPLALTGKNFHLQAILET